MAVSSSLASPRVWRTPTAIDLHGVPLTEREIGGFYRGFANRTL